MSRLALIMGLLLAAAPAYAQAEHSEGTLGQSNMAMSADPGYLRIRVEQDAVAGGAEAAPIPDAAKAAPISDAAKAAPLTGVVQEQEPIRPEPIRARTQKNADPDSGDAELMLAWDKWRNKFAHAVWQRYCQTLYGAGTVYVGAVPIKLINSPSYHFPDGLAATYTCGIRSDRRIAYAKITASSGDPQLDAIILDAVVSMDGKHLMAFPKGSQRQFVLEHESLGTGPSGWHTRDYGDVEKVSQRPQ